MMTSFALITEGITDQVTLEAIILEHYASDFDIDINPLQPLRDSTDENRQNTNFGGWEKVLEYCSLSEFRDCLLFNEYVVIQIDTDKAEHKNFGVQLTENGVDRPQIDVIRDVVAILINKIGEDFYNEFREQIIFAISVHSIECWFLPLFAKLNATKSKSKGCTDALILETAKKNLIFKKEYEVYRSLARSFKTKNAFQKCEEFNESFSFFIKSLPNL